MMLESLSPQQRGQSVAKRALLSACEVPTKVVDGGGYVYLPGKLRAFGTQSHGGLV